ncbi:hypothetical protein RF55_740 [Lasius niger]|uniref:Uncharacterized protein n=1 Tax=Lasius niger TaxID=67767 RepID=A0A0J7L8B8_LASNI|nr:hypothetical protein RF55_740 [Lasius niger]
MRGSRTAKPEVKEEEAEEEEEEEEEEEKEQKRKKKTKQPELHTEKPRCSSLARFASEMLIGRGCLDASSTTYDGEEEKARIAGRRLSVARSTAATKPPPPLRVVRGNLFTTYSKAPADTGRVTFVIGGRYDND